MIVKFHAEVPYPQCDQSDTSIFMTSLVTACVCNNGTTAALTAESIAEIVCELGKDSSAYENDTEDEVLVNGAECIEGIEHEGVDGAVYRWYRA